MVVSLLAAVAVFPGQLAAEEEPAKTEADQTRDEQKTTDTAAGESRTRHRLDLGFDHIGRGSQSIETLSLGYTWAPAEHHSTNITTHFIDSSVSSQVDDSTGYLLSDTTLYYSWARGYDIEARPWLPNRFGSGVGLVVPTGDAEKGAGGDMWVVSPYLGLVKLVGKKLIILPILTFSQSFAEGDLAIPFQAIGAEIGLLLEITPKWWLFYRPTVLYDFELQETAMLNLLQLGRKVGGRHGVNVEYGRVSDEVYSQLIGFRSNSNYRLTLTLQFGFG